LTPPRAAPRAQGSIPCRINHGGVKHSLVRGTTRTDGRGAAHRASRTRLRTHHPAPPSQQCGLGAACDARHPTRAHARRSRVPTAHAPQIWTRQPEELSYDPLLLLFAEGLRETTHPHTYTTRTAFAELLQAPGGYEKARAYGAQRVREAWRVLCLISAARVAGKNCDAATATSHCHRANARSRTLAHDAELTHAHRDTPVRRCCRCCRA
jgi:hypothetical protein